MSLCSDERCKFSADEYHNNEAAADAGTVADAADDGWPPRSPRHGRGPTAAAATADGPRPCVAGRGSHCWSCTATDGSDDHDHDRDDDNDDDGQTAGENGRPPGWKRKLSRLLFGKKRGGR